MIPPEFEEIETGTTTETIDTEKLTKARKKMIQMAFIFAAFLYTPLITPDGRTASTPSSIIALVQQEEEIPETDEASSDTTDMEQTASANTEPTTSTNDTTTTTEPTDNTTITAEPVNDTAVTTAPPMTQLSQRNLPMTQPSQRNLSMKQLLRMPLSTTVAFAVAQANVMNVKGTVI